MIITVASFKGGVGKTTIAVHLAAYLQQESGETILVDGDPNRSASRWARQADKLPFLVVAEEDAGRQVRRAKHVVIDTQARPSTEDLKALIEAGEFLVVPTTPDFLSLDALIQSVRLLEHLGAAHYKVLLSRVPPPPRKEGEDARAFLVSSGIPVFAGRVREFVAFQKAALAGLVVSDVSDRNAKIAWADFKAVGKELINEPI
jgi:chromosome partitioning protein